jgi:predicted permease
MQLVFQQILIILLYVAVGFGAGRLRLITPDQRRYLSGLCSTLILPFTILSAASLDVGGKEMGGMLVALGFTMVLYLCVTGISVAFHKARKAPPEMTAAATSLLTYPNCTFLGLPLCRALFGEMAVLYNASALIAFNLLFFTVQHALFTGSRANLKNLVTPSMLSTVALVGMLAAGLHFPAPVQTVISGVGSMITPLSLIIIGVMLSESALGTVLRQKRSYIIAALRNLVIPLAGMLVLRLLPLDADARLCVLVYLACPCATLTSIYAIRYDKAPEFCAHTVILSTLLFAATLPLIIGAGQAML